MSTVKTNNAQIGQSATATNNFTMYQPASPDGTVRWGVGNAGSVTDIVTLNSSGNVGIGTSSPTNALTTLSSAATSASFQSSNAVRAWIGLGCNGQTNANWGYLGVDNNYAMILAPNNTERMRLDSSGNLGLGVTPSAWRNTGQAFQNSAGGLWNYLTTFQFLGQNYYYNSSANRIYSTTAAATEYEQSSGAHKWWSASSGTAGDVVTFTQVLSVKKDQTLSLQGATPQSGTGITFPATQSASSDANTLDDYEEGTWTPSYYNGTVTYGSGRFGTYIKIGKMVYIDAYVPITTITGQSGYVILSGLPFTTAGTYATQYSKLATSVSSVNFGKSFAVAQVSPSNTTVQLQGCTNNEVFVDVALTAFSNGSWISITGCYIASA